MQWKIIDGISMAVCIIINFVTVAMIENCEIKAILSLCMTLWACLFASGIARKIAKEIESWKC